MKTLIVIDAQNDFMPGGSLSVSNGDKIVPVINTIQDSFDLVVATQDWHPQNHISFASNHPGKAVFDEILVESRLQTLWPDHCVQNTEGAEFHYNLNTESWETIFRKGTDFKIDSYSAFYDNGRLKSTGLSGYLKGKGAKQLYFCGLAADICVYFSICDAVEEGFSCFFIDDASKPLDVEGFKKMKKELEEKGVRILTSDEI